MSGLELRQGRHRRQPLAGIFVQLFQPEVRQHPVLSHHGNQIGRNTHDQQIQQRDQRLERYVVLLGIGLHKFEADSAAGQIVKGIVVIRSLRIQHRHGRGQRFLRMMMAADYNIIPLSGRVFHLLVGLDAAVQGDDQPETIV